MGRRMSVAMTQQQVIGRTKTVTRRKGWWLDKHGRHLVKPGDHLILVDRVMGFKKGERATVLAEVEVVSVRRESLRVLADWCGDDEYREQCAEIRREGFDPARIGPAAFVYRYFVKAQGMSFDDDVTRIEWRYLDDEADETVARLGAQVHRLLADVVHLSGEHDRAIGLDAMTPDLWTHLVSEMLARGDLDMIPSALALCATHGHPEHAEYLRQVMLVGAALAGGE